MIPVMRTPAFTHFKPNISRFTRSLWPPEIVKGAGENNEFGPGANRIS